ncbi:hypothetical protein LT493_15360 [Streptomyces tricolor]|nr:hypothetical protein [Streptomyces tricolor]
MTDLHDKPAPASSLPPQVAPPTARRRGTRLRRIRRSASCSPPGWPAPRTRRPSPTAGGPGPTVNWPPEPTGWPYT